MTRKTLPLPFALLLVAGAANAQLGLPGLPPLPAGLDRPIAPVVDQANARLRELRDLRPLQIRALRREHPEAIDIDFRGEPVVRGEILMMSLDEPDLAALSDAGFDVQRRLALDALGVEALVLRAPPRMGTRQAVRRLRALAPGATVEFNHIYLGAGDVGRAHEAAHDASRPSHAYTVGLIDSGVDVAHTSLRGVVVERWGCDGRAMPAMHGTAVASLLVGDAGGPVAEGTRLLAADIYCDEPAGGAATRLAQAMAWLADGGARVINVSLVGADNALLRQTIHAMQERGHLIVAAVGNDGPNAAPLYPAAYTGVVGVTAVDGRQRLLPEALRGEQVAFAAPGAGFRAAALAPDQWQRVRGTSFAAPLVARLAAIEFQQGASRDVVLERLRSGAIDLGERGRDHRFGHGLVGVALPLQDGRRR